MPQSTAVISLQNQELSLTSLLRNRALEYPIIATTAATVSSVVAASNLPIVYSTITTPLVSAATRQVILSLFSHPGQTYFQRLAMGYFAETSAANMISSGMAPYVLGAASGATVFSVLAATSLIYSSLQGMRQAYRAYSYQLNEQLVIYPQVEVEQYFISRIELENIIKTYQSKSPIRRTLGLFISPCNKSGEIANLEKYLVANPDTDFVSLHDLSKAMVGNGVKYKYRLTALSNHHSIDNGREGILSATDAVLNSIIRSSFLTTSDRLDALKTLGLNPCQIPSKDELNKAFRRESLKHHPDRPDGSKEKFQQIAAAKDYLDKFLGKLEHDIPQVDAIYRFGG